MTRADLSLMLIAGCLLLGGCRERASSVPEREGEADGALVDAGLDAGSDPNPAPDPEPETDPDPEPEPAPDPEPEPAPACAYTPEPLAACTPPAAPDAECTVRIAGDRRFVATFADRRLTSLLDGEGSGVVVTFDDPSAIRRDTVETGCVERRLDERRSDDGLLSVTVDRRGARCSLQTWQGGDLLEQLEDQACDCRDLVPIQVCAYGPQGPTQCTWRLPDGSLQSRRLWTYAAGGDTLEVQRYRGGVLDTIDRTTTDRDGRPIEDVRWVAMPGADPVVERRTTYTYSDDPQQTTERQDAGDDGRAEFVRRTTREDGRVVRIEEGDDDGFTTVIETAYRADGYDRITTVDGEQTRSERRVRGGDGVVVTTIITPERAQTETVTADAEGRLIERVIAREPGGTYTERLTWDAEGRLLSEQIAFTGEPAFECALAYDWRGDCPGPAGRFNDACGFDLPP